jgi:hypothetical protein
MIEEKVDLCHKLKILIPVDSVKGGGEFLNGGIS